MRELRVGQSAQVEVPATSANLGPGFDSLGLALNWYDRSKITVVESGIDIRVTGEGEGSVPRDENHLVVATVIEALAAWDVSAPGLRLEAHNTIPHGRGLGSSSAALVGGLIMAWELAFPGEEVDRIWLLREAFAKEGHADNVAPAIHGGFVLSWSGDAHDNADAGLRSRTSQVHASLAAVALIPRFEVLTKQARSVLPESVSFSTAVANASRTALLVHAIGQEPSLLLEATADRLHQDQRGELMPRTLEMVRQLRSERFGAFVSGAGPTVLVLLDQDELPRLYAALRQIDPEGTFTARELRPGYRARIIRP